MGKYNDTTIRVFELTAYQFKNEIQEYFDEADQLSKPYLTIGIANKLGIHKDTMAGIRRGKSELFKGTHHQETLQWAHQKVEEYLAEMLFSKNVKQVTGSIFTLKSNFGWTDKQEIQLNTSGKINIKFE